MDFIKKHKMIILLIILFVVLISLYFIREFLASKTIYTESYLDDKEYIMTPKTYGVNQYSPVNITDEQMADIYLNDFKYNLFNDINSAYLSLNEEYRNIKFGSFENFVNYVNGLKFSNIILDRYSVSGDKKIFRIYTEDNQKYIFKVNSVMEYEVYLDDYTVEI